MATVTGIAVLAVLIMLAWFLYVKTKGASSSKGNN